MSELSDTTGPTCPKVCPQCGADLTVQGAVTVVYEDYVEALIGDDGEIEATGDSCECGDAVRAFCTAGCGFYFYGDYDQDPSDRTLHLGDIEESRVIDFTLATSTGPKKMGLELAPDGGVMLFTELNGHRLEVTLLTPIREMDGDEIVYDLPEWRLAVDYDESGDPFVFVPNLMGPIEDGGVTDGNGEAVPEL